MKAAIVEKPNTLVVRDIPEPVCGDYDALCQLLYGATCTGTDQHLISGRFPWPIKYPAVLGHESVGRVVKTGSRVRFLKRGDLVARVGTPRSPTGAFEICWGGFTELGLAKDFRAMKEDGRPESEWTGSRIHQPLPAGIDPAGATMIITWRETLSYITRLGFKPGMSLLVVGSGGNGLSFAAHAVHMGAKAVGVAGSQGRKSNVMRTGAGLFFDYKSPKLVDEIKAASPDGFDFIIDAVGKKGELDRVLPALKSGGTVGIYGIDDFGACLINPNNSRGTFTFCKNGYDEAETHERVVELIRAGKLDASIWLDPAHTYPLADINAAFDAVRGRKCVKALVRLSGE